MYGVYAHLRRCRDGTVAMHVEQSHTTSFDRECGSCFSAQSNPGELIPRSSCPTHDVEDVGESWVQGRSPEMASRRCGGDRELSRSNPPLAGGSAWQAWHLEPLCKPRQVPA